MNAKFIEVISCLDELESLVMLCLTMFQICQDLMLNALEITLMLCDVLLDALPLVVIPIGLLDCVLDKDSSKTMVYPVVLLLG